MHLFQLARSLQKHVARLKSVGYSHPPIENEDSAEFKVYINGVCYLVAVKEFIEPSIQALGITTLRN